KPSQRRSHLLTRTSRSGSRSKGASASSRMAANRARGKRVRVRQAAGRAPAWTRLASAPLRNVKRELTPMADAPIIGSVDLQVDRGIVAAFLQPVGQRIRRQVEMQTLPLFQLLRQHLDKLLPPVELFAIWPHEPYLLDCHRTLSLVLCLDEDKV